MTAPAGPWTAADMLAAWDRGEPVATVEMGGIGPNYELAIHCLVFEMIRDALAGPPVPALDVFTSWPEATQRAWWEQFGAAAVERTRENGYSGVQVGAARRLAYQLLTAGWPTVKRHVAGDRLILVHRPPAGRP